MSYTEKILDKQKTVSIEFKKTLSQSKTNKILKINIKSPHRNFNLFMK